MSLYFDTRVQNPNVELESHLVAWHSNLPLLAVAAQTQNKAGLINVYDDQGELLTDVESCQHFTAQVTALAWHPEKKLLATAWENGELRVWAGDIGLNNFSISVSPHKHPITILQWSQYGGHLVSGDIIGSLVGWKMDKKNQLILVFHHELKQSLTHIAFKISSIKPIVDMSVLAKAAVAGDERALDLFSSWRPRTAIPSAISVKQDNYAFYVGTINGIIYYIDHQTKYIKVLNLDGVLLHCLLHHQTKESIVIMSEGLHIGHFQTDPVTGRLTELTKVKLSSRSDLTRNDPLLCWAGINTLAILAGESVIRMWDLYTGDTYVLSPNNNNINNNNNNSSICSYSKPKEVCTSLSFCKNNDTLAVGTNLGLIYLWKRKIRGVENDENCWPSTPDSCSVSSIVKQITWGATMLRNPLLAVNCTTDIYIFHHQPICAAYNNGVSACQVSPKLLHIEIEEPEQKFTIKTDIQVQIVAVNMNYIAVSSGRHIVVYKVYENVQPNTTVVMSFAYDTKKLFIYDTILIILTSQIIQLRSIEEGTIIQNLSNLPEEGEPIIMELTKCYLTVASLNGILKIWELGKREAKLHTRAMATYEVINDFAEIIEARCNSDCKHISITVAKTNLMPSSILYVWEIESNKIHEFDFSENDNEDESVLIAKCKGRLVTAHCWDNDDPRVLICRAQKPESLNTKSGNELIENNETTPNTVLITMFVTQEYGIVIQDVRSIQNDNCQLLSVQSPFINVLDSENSSGSKVVRLLMRNFEELGNCDLITKRAILDFSFYLSVADMDEAFKAIKTIQNEVVWKSLAKMCVKTKQLDMAMLCLGHMKQARSVRALREAMQDDELNLDAKVGILAVELKLYSDAERLFREANRYDLLGSLLEARNKFNEAIELAKTEHKIREKTSYYNNAKALELEGKINEAIEMYTKADCHRFEVPRMLLTSPKELQNYLNKSDDLEIKRWHAQYTESMNDMETALKLYQQAQDQLSITRLLCYFGREEEACDLITKSKHAASAYHLAAHYESKGNVSQAVHYYTMARAHTNAIRVCKENHLSEELLPLAMMTSRHTQIDVAKYFEWNGQVNKAIALYHKAGLLKRALDLAFSTKQFDALQLIIMDVNADSDPELIEKCAEYFVQNSQIDKAVDLLAAGRKYKDALQLIHNYDVTLSEELAEKMTLDKTETDLEKERLRVETLEQIGEIALNQGNHHLATKKFTQAGNKLRAMKALLKSGDTDKICFFAQVSRQREIYIMAGNYLQSLDWQNQPEVLKNIINFYSKGKAMDLLANFYVACAQVEIDEFQNYDKALDALTQANKCLSKVTDSTVSDVHKRATAIVNSRIATITKFLEIKELFDKGDVETAMGHVRFLLSYQGANLEQSIRRGDLFAIITQYYVSREDLSKARASIEELLRLVPGINLNYYFEAHLLDKLGFKVNVERQESSDREDDIEEMLGD